MPSEIAALRLTSFLNDLGSVTLSPVSIAALGTVSQQRGLSLRFPRFMKVREDKSIEMASTTDFLAGMFRQQQGRGKDTSCVDDGELVDMQVEDKSDDDKGSD